MRNDEYRQHAGLVVWPASQSQLTATDLCPACFASLTTTVCPNCGLDVRHPAAAELLSASTAADRALSKRVEVIGRIRMDTAAAERAREAAMAKRIAAERLIDADRSEQPADAAAHLFGELTRPAAVRPDAIPSFAAPIAPPTPDLPTTSEPAPIAPAHSPSRTVAAPPEPASAPRRSSVQVVLLIVGVSLLSVGAIAFLVYAFVNYGIVWRSVIIGAVTVTAFLVASALQRRTLHATAEGIAAFAVVLVYLDAYAIRANDLFGAAAVDGALYYGVALVVASAGFIAWRRISGLRTPSVAGFTGFAPGVGLIAAGVGTGMDDPTATCVIALSVALAGTVHRLAGWRTRTEASPMGGSVERALVLATSVAALAIAALYAPFISSRVDADDTGLADAAPAVAAMLAVAAIATLHVLLLATLPSRTRHTERWGTAFSVILSLAVATIGFAVAGHGSGVAPYQFLPVVIAAVAALGGETAERLLPNAFLRGRARPAWVVAASVGIIGVLFPVTTVAFALSDVVQSVLGDAWTVTAGDRVFEADATGALAAAAVITVATISAIAWRASGVLRARAGLLAWYSAIALLLAVPVLGTLWVILAAWLALAAGALALLLRFRLTESDALRPPLIALLGGATVLLYVGGWWSLTTWAPVAISVIVILLIARMLADSAFARAVLLSIATVVLLFSAASAGRQLTFYSDPSPLAWTTDPVRFAGITGVLILAATAVLAGRQRVSTARAERFTAADQRVLFWIGTATALIGTAVLQLPGWRSPTVLPEPVTGLVVGVALLGALLLWTRRSLGSGLEVERVAASVLLAPAVWLGADSIMLTASPQADRVTAPAVAALVVGSASLLSRKGAARRGAVDIGTVTVVALGALIALAVDSDLAWLVLALAAVSLLIVSVARTDERMSATLVGAATLSAIGAAAYGAAHLSPALGTVDAARLAQTAAILLLTISAFRLGAVASALDRRTIFWFSFAAVAIAELSIRLDPVPSELVSAPVSLAVRCVLLIGLLLWVASPSTAEFRAERIAASVAAGPAVYLAVDAFAIVLGLPQLLVSVVPITAALLTSAGSLAVTLIRPRSANTRRYREIGVAIVGVPALAVSVVLPDESTWLTLLLGAVAALLVATSADGVFASSAPRRHFGWVALALAIAGLWARMADAAVTTVEPYTLPVAGLVLLVALLTHRGSRIRAARHRIDEDAVARSRPVSASAVLFLAGLLIAILPIAALSVTGAPARAIVIGAASAVLLLIGAFVPAVAPHHAPGRGVRPFLDATALAGAVGVLVTSVGRAAVLVSERPESLELDAWLLGGVAVLVVAAFGLTTVRDDPFTAQRSIAGQVIAVLALAGLLVIESVAIARVEGTILRPMGIVLLFCAVHLIGFIIDRAPFTRPVAWFAIGAATIIAGIGIVRGSLDPLEAGTVPIALALIASGTVQLDRDRSAGSWRWLAPGVTVLLLPSLIATIDDRPLWRLVGIGVLGVLIVAIGVIRRLQAPFVIASVLVVIHAVATFAPQIRATYESVAWWLWLVIGGIILIVLAARYEQRLKNLRDVVERIAALR